jgi:hypothetical protein
MLLNFSAPTTVYSLLLWPDASGAIVAAYATIISSDAAALSAALIGAASALLDWHIKT